MKSVYIKEFVFEPTSDGVVVTARSVSRRGTKYVVGVRHVRTSDGVRRPASAAMTEALIELGAKPSA